jgi:hypothetical protein
MIPTLDALLYRLIRMAITEKGDVPLEDYLRASMFNMDGLIARQREDLIPVRAAILDGLGESEREI